MFWQEDSGEQSSFKVPDDVVDVLYSIDCKNLPLDHAHALSVALHEALPWLINEPMAGVHLIHVAESGNGWFRPEDPENEILCVSHRTKMTLRLPKERLSDAEELIGKHLKIADFDLQAGKFKTRPLSVLPTMFARYVVAEEGQPEEEFLGSVVVALEEIGIATKKILCGKIHRFNFPDSPQFCRSVMLADLGPEAAVKLQEQGLGPGRKTGFGLFLAHKGIRAVKETT